MSSRAPSRSEVVERARKRLAPKAHLAYAIVPPLAKGDLPGHPFRGNQYSDGLEEVEVAAAGRLGLPITYAGKDSAKRHLAVDSPLPQAKSLTHEQIKSITPAEMDAADSTMVEVKVADLRVAQDYLNPTGVRDYAGQQNAPITVVHAGGETVVVNGAHRLMAAVLDGRETMRVTDLGDFASLKPGQRSWDDFPWDEATQEKPREKDIAPERTPEGDFVFYHGTSDDAADSIIRDLNLRPDDLGAVGVGSRPEDVSVYGYLRGRKTGTVVRVVIARDEAKTHRAIHEIGGSNHNQFLFEPESGIKRGWPGVKLKEARVVRRLGEKVGKGDFDGHPFRGNQYSDVASGGGGPTKRPSAQREAIARGRAARLAAEAGGESATRGDAGMADRSPEFREWFKGSKAVDAAGLPLAVFHGSFAVGIEEFDRHQGGAWDDGIKTVDTAGIWFTTDARQAESIFSPGPNAPPDDGALYRVHLAVKNPRFLGRWEDVFVLADELGARIPGKKGTESVDGDVLREKLIARGFDGLHIKGAAKIDGGNGDYWVAFHPHQIKATTNKRPTSSASIHKGDFEGHPFRGNQYTQGEGGGGHDTPEFKEWFGDSKIVDADGKPLVVYHGQLEKDPEVLSESFEAGAGIFLTDNESVADTFTLPREYGEPVFEDEDGNEIEPGTVVAAYVSMQNPLVISGREAQDVVEDTPLQARTIARAKADGHDGIILRGVLEGIGERYRSDNFIVFDPAQVKATGNKRPTKHPGLTKGDVVGHPFRGNQYTDGVWSESKAWGKVYPPTARDPEVTWDYPEWAQRASKTHAYRGVTSEEMESIRASGEVKSTGASSLPGEGTNFGENAATAISYVSVGRDNPARTGKPVFVVEVRRQDHMTMARDGYLKTPQGTPASEITRVWRFDPDGKVYESGGIARKGDLPGHPFRGNQWTDGADGVSAPDTKEFKRWFGKSKVVGTDGQPIPVFHGTLSPEQFDVFDREFGDKKRGVRSGFDQVGNWFTTSRGEASNFDGSTIRGRLRGAKVGDEAPAEANAPPTGSVGAFFLSIKKPKAFKMREIPEFAEAHHLVSYDFDHANPGFKGVDGDRLRRYLISEGFDGMRIVGGEGRGDFWVAFNPEQIKAPTNHRPTKDPSIHKGDLPGHPFRGNQYTQGSGGGVRPLGSSKSPHSFGFGDIDAIQDEVERVALKMGFEGEVRVSERRETFTLNGETHEMAGGYDADTGEITIYARSVLEDPSTRSPGAVGLYVDDDALVSIVAHEIGHADFLAAFDAQYEERLQLKQYTKPDGSLTPEAERDLPITYAMRRAKIDGPEGIERLAKEDGCTEYSREWWKAYRDGTVTSRQAIDETFAEIEAEIALSARGGEPPDLSPTWKAYHRIMKAAARGMLKLAKGDLPGHEFRGNQWTEGVAAARAAVEEVCAATGFPSSRIDVVDDPPEMITFDGLPNSVAGVFNAKKDGRITIYPRATDEMHRKYPDWNVRGVIAHEIAHAQYSAAWDADPVAMSKLERGWEKLAPGGGTISPYAKAFWDDVTYWRGRSSVVHSAISETLSEIHRIVMGGDPLAKAAPPEWRKAYRTVQRLAAKVKKGDFAGHPFRGNQYTDGVGGGPAGDGGTKESREARMNTLLAETADEHNKAAMHLGALAHWARDHGDARADFACLQARIAHDEAMYAARSAERARGWLDDMQAAGRKEGDADLLDQQRKVQSANVKAEDARQKAESATEAAFKEVDRVEAKLEEDAARFAAIQGSAEWKAAESKVTALTKEFGYKGRVELTDETYHVSLMGQEFNAAGSASFSEDGHIKIYVREWNGISDTYARTVVAHEIGHMEYTAARAAVAEEGRRMQESDAPEYRDAIREAEAKGIEGDARYEYAQEHAIMRADGTLTVRGRREFPLYAQQEDLDKTASLETLAEEDGVTPYSTRWWNAWKAREANTEQALHETFAEIRALERAGKKVEDVAKPAWQKYFAAMRDLGTARLKRQGREA